MARWDETAAQWQARKAEREQRRRERNHAREHAGEFCLEQTLTEIGSPDEATRARAARQLCPCRTDWNVFEGTLDTLRKLTKDPSPMVRANALHVFEDAFELVNEGLPTTPQALTNEMVARRRQMRWADDPADRDDRKRGKPPRRC